MNGSLGRASGGWRWSVSAAVVYFAVVLASAPIGSVVRFDADEGNNLMKARLCARGYGLYDPVWSDQPPGLTYELEAWQWMFGESVTAGRILILLHASLLVGLLFDLVRRSVGLAGASAAVVFVVVSPNFVRLSVSVMVGMPALALGMASIWLMRWYGANEPQRGKLWWVLVLSALAMAGSMSIKLFTGLLVPWLVMEAARLSSGRPEAGSRRMKGMAAGLLWLGILALSGAAMAWWSGAAGATEQLLGTHLRALEVEAYGSMRGIWVIRDRMAANPGVLVLALMGCWWAYRERRGDAWLAAAWAGSAVTALCIHQPVWYHQLLLMEIPLAWLAGYGGAYAAKQFRLQGLWARPTGRWRVDMRNYALRIAVAAAAAYAAIGGVDVVRDSIWRVREEEVKLVEVIGGGELEDRWVVTDDPLFAVHAGLLSVPETAMLTRKRWATDPEFERMLMEVIEREEPGRILIGRQRYSEAFMAWLEARYTQEYEMQWLRYFVRK